MIPVPALPALYRRNVKKWLLILVVSLVFVAVGVSMIRGGKAFDGYLSVLFFGAGAIASLMALHPQGSYLELSEGGFEFAGLFRRTFVRWQDVKEFCPVTICGTSIVGWNYTSSFTGSRTLSRSNSALAGVEAFLPDSYGMLVADLSELLNVLRRGAQVSPNKTIDADPQQQDAASPQMSAGGSFLR
jgi:hypothetical protein